MALAQTGLLGKVIRSGITRMAHSVGQCTVQTAQVQGIEQMESVLVGIKNLFLLAVCAPGIGLKAVNIGYLCMPSASLMSLQLMISSSFLWLFMQTIQKSED